MFPLMWELLDRFKEHYKSKWHISEKDDLIKAGDEYHKFYWTPRLHPNTFKNVVSHPVCPVCDGFSHRLVRLSYTAWILPETPSWDVWLYLILEAPRLSRTVALYDLSHAYRGGSRCYKLNETGSIVFQGFEQFLNDKYGITFSPITRIRPTTLHLESHGRRTSASDPSRLS